MRSDWIDTAIRDITGLVLDLGPAAGDYAEPKMRVVDPEAIGERWRRAEANSERVIQGLPPEWDELPTSTVHAAVYVAALNDPERAAAFAVGRSAAERSAILHALIGIQS